MPPDDAMTEAYPVRRMEVFTGAGRRRAWSAEDKGRIVAESYSGLESVSAVARRYGLAQSQLFAWRRELRPKTLPTPELVFTPVVVEPAAAAPAPAKQPARRRRRRGDGGIELEIDGVVVRVGRGAEAKTVAAVIRALKADK